MAQPNPVLLFHDKRLLGRQNVVSVTSEASRYAGVSVAGLSNEGDLFPLLYAPSVTEDYAVDIGLVRAGGLYRQAEWMWKDQTDADILWRGVDQITWLENPHDPWVGQSGTRYVTAACFSKRLNRIFLYWATTSGTLRVRYRDAGAAPTSWTTTTTATLDNAFIASSGGSMEVLEMPDGSLRLLIVTGTAGGSDNDVDVYCSTDGLTWSLGARNVISKAIAATLTISKMRAAVSGDWIRMVTTNATTASAFVSSDYGASFLQLSDLTDPIEDNGDDEDPFGAFDLEGLDDAAGTFVMIERYKAQVATGTPQMRTASRDEDWSSRTALTQLDSSSAIFRVALVRTATHLVLLLTAPATGGGTNGGFFRGGFIPIDNATDSSVWQYVAAFNGGGGAVSRYMPAFVTACEADGGFLVAFGLVNEDATGAAVSGGGIAYGQSWSSRTMWNDEVIDDATDFWDVLWDSVCGGPLDGTPTASAVWGQISGVNSSETWLSDYWTIQSTNVVNGQRYQCFHDAGLGQKWADGDVVFEWIVRFPTGAFGGGSDDRCAVRVRAVGASAGVSLDFSVRHALQAITLYDNGAGVAALTLSAAALTTSFYVVRAAIGVSGSTRQVELAACPVDELGDGWVVGTANLTSTAATTFQGFDWGALIGQSAMTQQWRRFGYSETENWHQYGFENPTTLRGAPVSAAPWAMKSGVYVQWSGGAGFELDTWTNEVRHHYEVENLFLPSPQAQWRSTSLTSQAIVFDADPENGRGIFDHAGIAIFGTSHRGVRVDYNSTNSWASPASTTTLQADLVGGLTVSAVGAGYVDVSGVNLVDGAYDGKYLHFQSGPWANASLTIAMQVGNRLYLTSSASVTTLAVAGNSCLIHDDRIVELYTSRARFRYMRISLTGVTTATGDARIGHIVAGQTFGFDNAAVDWEHTQTEQSGVEIETGFQGLRWALEVAAPRRVIECSVTGDASRVRETMRNHLRNWQQLSVRPLCFIWDRDDTPATALLVRFDGDIEYENAGWRQAPNGTWFTIGTQGFVFSEEL